MTRSEGISGRIAAIDGLRACAVGLVLVGHATPWLLQGGMGVDLFFVISGYVITRHLIEKRPSFRTFYMNRFQRLFPPAILVILVTLALSVFVVELTTARAAFVATFSLMNWARAFGMVADGGGWLGHYWSLSIEEQFYFIWPLGLSVLLARKFDPRRVLAMLLVAVVAWRFYLQLKGVGDLRIYNGLDTRSDGLIAGCLIAFARPRVPQWAAVIALTIIVALAFTAHRHPLPNFDFVAYPAATALSTLVVAHLAASQGWLARAMSTPIAQWGGARSYSIYLWHYPLLGVCFGFGGKDDLIYIACAVALTLCASELSYRIIERPLQQRRHSKSRTPLADGQVQVA